MREEIHIQQWMNTIEEFMIVIDEQGFIIRVNQAWLNFCTEHHAPETVWKIGSDYYGHLDKLGKKSELQAIQQVVNKVKKEHKQMYPFSLRDGGTQWFSARVRHIQNPNNQSNGAIVFLKSVSLHTVQPITAESVLESMTEGFCLLDNQFKINYMNEIGEQLLQVRREDVIGRELWDVFPEAVGTKFDKEYHRALEEHVTVQFEEFLTTIDTWFNVKVYPLKRGGLALYFQDISERKETEQKLMEYAYYDFLTGLPNRRLMTEKAIALREQNEKFSVFYINLDNLKFVNLLHNYYSGDKVLIGVAEKLKLLSNEECVIGRLDGDEFIVIRIDNHDESLEEFADKLKEVFEQPFLLDDFQSVNVFVSIGIACYPNDTKSLGELLSFAETAMFEAKKIRGSRYSFFRPLMIADRDRRVQIEEGLMGNLSDNGFYYTVQPQIDGISGELVGVEVLSRWNHPKFGELSPLEFIEVAEQSGTIASLTYMLLENVFTKIKQWEMLYGWNLRTAINMTPSLLANPNFFDDFFKLIDQYEIKPELIEIEITEQAELTYSDRTLENLIFCKSKGISIAIDDFGTGFSMIAYLTHYPINKIKIDKFFIQKIGQDSKSDAVLKSLIHFAKSIECELLAEGVERPEEVAFLLANDCTIYQGYLYDKPLKLDDFEDKYLRKQHRFLTE